MLVHNVCDNSRVLDEGIVQEGVYLDEAVNVYKENSFKSIIYEVDEGEFKKEIIKISLGFVNEFDAKHYIIITKNFNIDIITDLEPEVIV